MGRVSFFIALFLPFFCACAFAIPWRSPPEEFDFGVSSTMIPSGATVRISVYSLASLWGYVFASIGIFLVGLFAIVYFTVERIREDFQRPLKDGVKALKDGVKALEDGVALGKDLAHASFHYSVTTGKGSITFNT